MAYSDPQSVTINAIAISLPRVSSGDGTGKFQSADGLTSLGVSHQYGKRTRSVLRLDQKKTVSDIVVPSQNSVASIGGWFVMDRPTFGYTNAEAKLFFDGFLAALTASSGAKITQALGGEA